MARHNNNKSIVFGGKSKRRPWWCIVCGSDEDDELKFGPLCKTKSYNVHFFCLVSPQQPKIIFRN